MNEEVKVMLDPGAYMPERAHEDDAGFDIRTPAAFVVYPGGYAVIDTGVHVEIPKGYAGVLKSKSGLNVRYGITNTGLIDCGYTGSIRVKLYNHGIDPVRFEVGDKVSQLVILPVFLPDLVRVDALGETERGNNGFGSTGR